MADFRWGTIIFNKEQKSLLVYLEGQTVSEHKNPSLQARAIFGGVTVAYKDLSINDADYKIVTSREELKNIADMVGFYGQFISRAIKGYKESEKAEAEQSSDEQDHNKIRASYLTIYDDVLPSYQALNRIYAGENDFGHAVWLEDLDGNPIEEDESLFVEADFQVQD